MRKENWPVLLSLYLKEKLKQPFSWGDNDCVMFAAKALCELTDQDFYKRYEGYTTEEGARKIIDEAGSIEALVSRHLGPPHENYLKAKRGDLVLMRLPEETLGLVDDSGQRVACLSEKRLVRLPLRKAALIWSY